MTDLIKAPWTVIEHSWSRTGIYDADRDSVAMVDIYDEATEDNQDALEVRTAARANLIAAAPNLAAACRAIDADIERMGQVSAESVDLVRAALKLVEGSSA